MMQDREDHDLLRDYAERGSGAAFAEIVRRHVNQVYSTALRHTRNAHQAEEITQTVFTLLAQKAGTLAKGVILSGWLYQTARLTAVTSVRSEIRRARREQEALMSNVPEENEAEAWQQIAPLLDEALDRLEEKDRHAIVLRFFDGKSMKQVGLELGGSEDAAKMRVSRAVEKLRHIFLQRGVTLSAATIAGAVAAHAVQAAPAGLATAFTSAALSGAALPTATHAILATTKTIAMTTAQKLIVAATVSVLAGAGIFEACQAAHLRQQNLVLEQQQAQLPRERAAASDPVAVAPAPSTSASTNDNNELLKLRGEVAVLRQRADAADEKVRAAEQKLAAELSAKEQFHAHQAEVVNTTKMVGLAMRIWAGDNNGLYPTNIMDMTNELALKPDASGNISSKMGNVDLFSFDYPNVNGFVQDHPNIVAGREQMARQAPDGTWQRIYLFADGSVQIATSFNGDFSGWEKANTYIPPMDPGQ
jgi:RNA polymerase sigma factor (sigma-70 family)